MEKKILLRKAGVIPSLVGKGLIEVIKKPISLVNGKKLKFLRPKRDEPSEPENRSS